MIPQYFFLSSAFEIVPFLCFTHDAPFPSSAEHLRMTYHSCVLHMIMTFPFLAEHLRVTCHKYTWSTRSPITSLAYLRKHCRAMTRQDSGSSSIREMRALYTRLTSFILTKASNTIVMLLKPESKAWNIVTSLLRVKQIKNNNIYQLNLLTHYRQQDVWHT